MPLNATQTAITKLYVGAFNRAPEKSGLEYWTAELNSGRSFNDVIDTVFSLPVVKAIYPDSMSDAAFLTAVYNNVFGRQPDAEGLAYWNAQIANGQQRGNVVNAMIDAGLGSPDGTPGKAYIVNRVEAAKYAAELQLIRGVEVDEHKLIELISAIDDIPANYELGRAAIDRAVPVPYAAAPGQPTTVSATANTDLFMFSAIDANNFRVINGLAPGDLVNVATADGTNGDYSFTPVGSAAAVDSRGEWFFDNASDNLFYFNEASNAQAVVQLTGVNALTVNQNAVFTVG